MPQKWSETKVVGGWVCQKSGFYYEKQVFSRPFFNLVRLSPFNETGAKSCLFSSTFGWTRVWTAANCRRNRIEKNVVFHRFFQINFPRSSFPYVFELPLIIITIFLLGWPREVILKDFLCHILTSLAHHLFVFHKEIDDRGKFGAY